MDGATLQNRVYYGYTQAALRIGLTFSQYRPLTASTALGAGNLLRTMPASFNAQDMKYGTPNGYAKPTWYCVADGRLLKVGDYLTAASGTFFIAAMQPLLPILAVECNRTVTIYRPQQQAGVGALGYGGNTQSNQTAVVTAFPASLLIAAKAERNAVNLPGDGRSVSQMMLLPPIPGGVLIMDDDIVEDDLGTRYLIFGTELTDLGWRCTVMESET
jgi:hypothetical protein